MYANIGRVARDAELKYFPSGGASLQFSFAVSFNKKNQAGEWEEKASFFTVKYTQKNAEKIANYLKKGKQIFIAGDLRQDAWEKDGKQQSFIYIQADKIQFVDKQSTERKPEPQRESQQDFGIEEFQDDIPF